MFQNCTIFLNLFVQTFSPKIFPSQTFGCWYMKRRITYVSEELPLFSSWSYVHLSDCQKPDLDLICMFQSKILNDFISWNASFWDADHWTIPFFKGWKGQEKAKISNFLTPLFFFSTPATFARYWITFFVFSVFPAPDSPLLVEKGKINQLQ